ncbi:thiamine pyrophosphate-binding protein [Agromyces silvae]|uniref:thiamine pyrophosphate-binding protein n=1 Tax=Agromyces silvae TaxID=3388266 RepID=UPI00280BB9F3|nr:thiamine pyrophosphate-binding protein [Agromyces protaetiae]
MTGPEPTESLGEFAVACLVANGVDTVFGIPGTHNIELYRGVRRHGVRHVLTRHEQGATYGADGYARATGRPGVVIATSGPGATNCITGIANAYADSVPLLVISPGAPQGQERRDLGFLHEAKDQRAGIDRFAAASIRVESKPALAEAIHQAFLSWRTGRARPVHIEIPTDLIGERSPVTPTTRWEGTPAVAPEASVDAAVDALARARRPMVVAGGGAVDAGAELTVFAELTGVPVVTTLQGKGVVDETHPLSLGARAGDSFGFAVLAEADLVLALGTELKHANIAPTATLVRIDIDAAQLHKHRRAELPVLGDVAHALRAMTAHPRLPRDTVSPGWVATVRDASDAGAAPAMATWSVLHAAVIEGARGAGDGPVVLTGDSSQISWLGTVQTAVLEGPRRFLTTDGYATLGYSLPAAIGATLAVPEARVVALLGDGAFMFSVQELATASELGIGLPVVVFDNGGYAEIETNMRDADLEPFAVALTPPDYDALARAFHCGYIEANRPDDLASAVREAFGAGRPTIIRITANDFAAESWRPANLRTEHLKESS